MNIKADLHTHTNYSDGVFTPFELIQRVSSKGVKMLAITDHDNVGAIEEATEIGKSLGVEIIPGVELSSDHKGKEVHMLGYFFDYKNAELLSYLEGFRKERRLRAERIIMKLNELGILINIEDVLANVKGNISIGRPHIAIALIEGNYVDSYSEAFSKYLADNKPAYVKKPNIPSAEAIKMIARFGGLSFIAHPGKNVKEEILIDLIELGIDGIETVHPSHSESDRQFFRKMTGQYFLLESGGSDFHGGRINDESILGAYTIDEQKIHAMRNRLFTV